MELTLFQASLPQYFLQFPPGIKNIPLPHPLYNRENFISHSKVNFAQVMERSIFLLNKLESIKPDMFVTEYYPFGHRESDYELLPVIKHLIKQKTNMYSSLGYPFFSQRCLPSLKKILPLYKKIFVHTPAGLEFNYAVKYLKETREKKRYSEIFRAFNEKIKYTGYVLSFDENRAANPESIRKKLMIGKKKLILVTRGAGAYYPKIISNAIMAKRFLKDYIFIIIAGPSTSQEEWRLFINLKRKLRMDNLFLEKYLVDLVDYLHAADLVISTAAYNTSVMLMYYKKKSIVVPFKGYNGETNFWEQPARARLLADHIGSRIIDYDELSPRLFSKVIKNQLERKLDCSSIDRAWFKGGENMARELKAAIF